MKLTTETFSLILDLTGNWSIEKSPNQYRPILQFYCNGKLLKDVNDYFANVLPNVNVKYDTKRERVTITNVKNILPIVEHIRNYTDYKKDHVSLISEFIEHRTNSDSLRKRYDAKDEEFVLRMRALNNVTYS